MKFDYENLFCNAVSVAGDGASTIIGDVIDAGVARRIGRGMPLYVLLQCIAAASGGTSVQFEIRGADDAALTTNPVVLSSSGVIAVATLVAGYQVPMGIIAPGIAKRYYGLWRTTVGAVTAITVTCGITTELQTADTEGAPAV